MNFYDVNLEVCNLRAEDERILASFTRGLIEIAAVAAARGSAPSPNAALTLNAMRLPAIALDQDGFVANVNAAAETIFDHDVKIKDRRLFISDPAARALLKDAIDQLSASPRLNPLATDPIIVQRQDKLSVFVRIWPFNGAAHLPAREVRALLTLNALAPKPWPSAALDELIKSSAAGDLSRVQALLAANGHVNAEMDKGDTALFYASENGHLGVVRALLAAKSDVNAKMDNGGETALIVASEHGHLEVVRALLAANADVNAKNVRWIDGGTALIRASWGGSTGGGAGLACREGRCECPGGRLLPFVDGGVVVGSPGGGASLACREGRCERQDDLWRHGYEPGDNGRLRGDRRAPEGVANSNRQVSVLIKQFLVSRCGVL